MITRYYSTTCDRCYATAEILATPTEARTAASKEGWTVNLPPGDYRRHQRRDLCPRCAPATAPEPSGDPS